MNSGLKGCRQGTRKYVNLGFLLGERVRTFSLQSAVAFFGARAKRCGHIFARVGVNRGGAGRAGPLTASRSYW